MYYRAIRNDVLRSKAVSLTIMLFVAAAAMLVALAATLVVNLSGAIDALMQRAETPHFMQMHVGDLHRARLDAFAEAHASVADLRPSWLRRRIMASPAPAAGTTSVA